MYPIKDFNYKALITYAEQLLKSDETLMALDILEKVPGYFRDHPIEEIQELKRKIMAKIATSSFYATHKGYELTITDEQCLASKDTLRAILISQEVKACNENKLAPHIWDMGPGEGALPVILRSHQLDFTYTQVYVNEPTYQQSKNRFYLHERLNGAPKDVPTIFVATEVIEHLHREDEIRFEVERHCGNIPDVIHVSTPLYSFNPNVDHWSSIGDLGHLRTYTPDEFRETVKKMFPEYTYAHYVSQVQHMRLVNPKTKFDFMKIQYEVKT